MVTFTEAQLMAWASPVFWPFLRVMSVLASAPIYSSRSVPLRTRIGLALLIAICLQPLLDDQPIISLTGSQALTTAVQQVVLGAAIGMVVRIVFTAIEMGGELVGLQMGLNFAGYFDPATSQQSSAVGRFFGNISMLLFIVLNGHLLIIQAVAASFHTFPLGGDILAPLQTLKLHELGGLIFSYGLWIALPMIGMLLFINIAMGIMSRIAPQMNVFAIGFPITLSIGLLGITFTLPMMDRPVSMLLRVVSDMFLGG